MEIEFRESFEKDLQKIKDAKILSKTYATITHIEAAPKLETIANIKKLKGYKNYYRIRIGDFRVGILYENRILVFCALPPSQRYL